MPLAAQQAGRRVQADPPRARQIDFGPGVQIAEIDAGSGRSLQRVDVRPQLEDIYNMEDVLVIGGMLLAMLRHADRLKIGCIAQVVNVIAPIMTRPGGGAWKQSIYYPLQHCSQYGRGTALRTAVSSPTYDSKSRDKAPYLATTAVVSESGDELTIFAINRSLTEPLELTTTLRGFAKAEVIEWITMHHTDLKAVNTETNPDNVIPQAATGATVTGETLKATLPASSWNVIRLRI